MDAFHVDESGKIVRGFVTEFDTRLSIPANLPDRPAGFVRRIAAMSPAQDRPGIVAIRYSDEEVVPLMVEDRGSATTATSEPTSPSPV